MTKRILSEKESLNLSALLREQKRINPLTQMPDKYFQKVPDTAFLRLAELGRRKYAAIVYVAQMSLRWKGWRSRKRRGRVEHDVMLTRRFMSNYYGYCENTIESAIQSLKEAELIEEVRKPAVLGSSNKNRGTTYKPLWMYEKPTKRNAWIFWGVLTSEAFLSLSITTQAILILLHLKLHRKMNILTCRPGDLQEFGVNRKIVTKHLEYLMHAGLLEHVDGHDYRFPWLVSATDVDTRKLKKNSLSINQASCGHSSDRESVSGTSRNWVYLAPRERPCSVHKSDQPCMHHARGAPIFRYRGVRLQ